MPIYVYFCEECGKELKARHSIKEKYMICQEVEDCAMSGTLRRLPSNFCTQHEQHKQERKVGSVVKDFIESNKEDIKKEKETLRNQEYEG